MISNTMFAGVRPAALEQVADLDLDERRVVERHRQEVHEQAVHRLERHRVAQRAAEARAVELDGEVDLVGDREQRRRRLERRAARTARQRLEREDVAGAEVDDRLVHASSGPRRG